MKLDEVEGIGPVYAEKLSLAGIATAEALLEQGATPGGRAAIEKATEIDGEHILEWVNHVDLMRINGRGLGVRRPARGRRRRLPGRAGATERRQSGDDLRRDRRRPSGLDPARPVRGPGVAGWIAEAKTLPRVVEH